MKALTPVVFCTGLTALSPAAYGAASEIDAVREQLKQMKQTYETRIEALEARLEELEQREPETPSEAAEAYASRGKATSNAFNPAIGLILDAKYRELSNDGEDFAVPGFSVGEEAGIGDDGLSLGESELNLGANIDDKFFGSFTAAFVEEEGEDKVEVEEAFVETLALPQGFTAKGGRFFSRIGYLNEFHTHADDFVDRPLPYRAFLNKQLGDDGVQLRWLAPTDLFVEVGGELFRGASFPAAGRDDDGKGAWTLFGHVGGDVGDSNSWRAGLSYVSADAEGRETGEEDAPDTFTGDSDLVLADFIWKWAPNGDPRRTNFKLQGEYFWRNEDGLFEDGEGSLGGPTAFNEDQTGWYVQGVYQFMPKWRVGLRYAQLDADDPGPLFAGTALDTQGHDPEHFSAMLDWSNSEFSRIRLQYNRDETHLDTDDQFLLQYIMSLGAHPAHQF